MAKKLNSMVFKAEYPDKSIFLEDKGSHSFDSLLSYLGLRPVQTEFNGQVEVFNGLQEIIWT